MLTKSKSTKFLWDKGVMEYIMYNIPE